jgi:hypothetical protein
MKKPALSDNGATTWLECGQFHNVGGSCFCILFFSIERSRMNCVHMFQPEVLTLSQKEIVRRHSLSFGVTMSKQWMCKGRGEINFRALDGGEGSTSHCGQFPQAKNLWSWSSSWTSSKNSLILQSMEITVSICAFFAQWCVSYDSQNNLIFIIEHCIFCEVES